ncbi:MAG: hypothetical protein ACREJQ_06720, partial [bacterium]
TNIEIERTSDDETVCGIHLQGSAGTSFTIPNFSATTLRPASVNCVNGNTPYRYRITVLDFNLNLVLSGIDEEMLPFARESGEDGVAFKTQ